MASAVRCALRPNVRVVLRGGTLSQASDRLGRIDIQGSQTG